MEPLQFAQVLKPQGLKGELKLKLFTDSPDDLTDVECVYLKKAGGYESRAVLSTRTYKQFGYVVIEGCTCCEDAERLRGKYLYIDRAELPEGAHYIADLIGMRVADSNGVLLGTLAEVMQTGGVDIYCVTGGLMFPAAPGIITDVDHEAGEITVDADRLSEVAVRD